MEPSPLKLKLTPKKRRLSTEKTKCIFCEVETCENTRKASAKGILAFLTALKLRKDVGDDNVSKYFGTVVEYGSEHEIKLVESESDIYWHKQCYCTFTSRDHITRLDEKGRESDVVPGPSSSKVRRQTFNWKELCMFCEKKSYKKDKCLINVVSDEFCDTLEERAKEKKDTHMDCKVGTLYRKLCMKRSIIRLVIANT